MLLDTCGVPLGADREPPRLPATSSGYALAWPAAGSSTYVAGQSARGRKPCCRVVRVVSRREACESKGASLHI